MELSIRTVQVRWKQTKSRTNRSVTILASVGCTGNSANIVPTGSVNLQKESNAPVAYNNSKAFPNN